MRAAMRAAAPYSVSAIRFHCRHTPDCLFDISFSIFMTVLMRTQREPARPRRYRHR